VRRVSVHVDGEPGCAVRTWRWKLPSPSHGAVHAPLSYHDE
jgi:hypothetical protein